MAKLQCLDVTITQIKGIILENDTRDSVREVLEKLEQKMGGTPIRICTEGKSSGRGKSKYNLFIGECIRGGTGPITERMKGCAAEWRKQKGK